MDKPIKMGPARRLFRCPLIGQEIPTIEGYQRVIAHLPPNGQVLFLGANPPDDALHIFVLAPDKFDKEGNPRQWEMGEMQPREFIVAIAGHLVPDAYKFRATVRGPQGVCFLFEKEEKSLIQVPGGRGL
jgi:hypothetical protein